MESKFACGLSASNLPGSFSGPAMAVGNLTQLLSTEYTGYINGTFSISNSTLQLLLQGSGYLEETGDQGSAGSFIQNENASMSFKVYILYPNSLIFNKSKNNLILHHK